MTASRLHTLLREAFRIGVLVTLALAPTQWSLEPRPKLHLSLADLALALTAALWAADRLVSRDWRGLLRLPPWPNLLFLGCVTASALAAADKAAALKEWVQYVEYFLVGALLFDAFLRDRPAAVRHGLSVLAAATAGILGLALWQYFSDAPTLRVEGSFGNRNVLGGYLTLALPLCFAALTHAAKPALKAAAALFLAAGFVVNLSGAAHLALLLVFSAMAASRGPRVFLPAAAALLLWQCTVLPRLPRENDLEHFRSVALYDAAGQAERRYPDWQAAYSMALTHPWLGVGLGSYQKHVGQYYDRVPRQTGPSEPDIQNLYLVLAASAGWPALLAFAAVLAAAVAAARALPCPTALAAGAAGSLCAFALAAVWHPLLVRGIGLPLVFVLALAYRAGAPSSPASQQGS